MTRPSPTIAARTFAVALTTVLLLAGSACAGSDDGDSTTSGDGAGATGGWEFVDDTGTTHALPALPTTIAAQSVSAGALAEYGVDVEGVFGPLRRADGSPEPSIGLADPDDFTSLGEIDSEINLEALAAMQPDIIVASMWDGDSYWGVDDDQIDELEQIAPIVGIRVDNRPLTEPLERYAELAVSLGARTADVDAARDRFQQASDDLESTLAATPDLRVVAASGTPAEMYIAYPPAFPDLRYYQSLGLQIAEPESHPTSGGFWETLSWEEAGKYPADVVLADARGGTVPQILEQLPATALALPAVEADQLYSWATVFAYGYGNVAEIIEDLTADLRTAEPTDAS